MQKLNQEIQYKFSLKNVIIQKIVSFLRKSNVPMKKDI